MTSIEITSMMQQINRAVRAAMMAGQYVEIIPSTGIIKTGIGHSGEDGRKWTAKASDGSVVFMVHICARRPEEHKGQVTYTPTFAAGIEPIGQTQTTTPPTPVRAADNDSWGGRFLGQCKCGRLTCDEAIVGTICSACASVFTPIPTEPTPEQPPKPLPTNANTSHPMQPIVVTPDNVLRFKGNSIVKFLLANGNTDLNKIAMMDFSDEDRSQLAQLIGYSVSGYGELHYATNVGEADAIAEELSQRIEDGKKMSEPSADDMTLHNEQLSKIKKTQYGDEYAVDVSFFHDWGRCVYLEVREMDQVAQAYLSPEEAEKLSEILKSFADKARRVFDKIKDAAT